MIALLTDGFYPFTLGGIQKHSYYLAKYWAQQGLQVHVYHPNHYKEEELGKYFTTVELNKISFIQVLHPSSIRFLGHYVYNSYRYSKALYQTVQQDSYDAIYAQGFTGWYFLNRNPFDNKIVTNLHGIEMYQKAINTKNKLQHYILRIAAKPIIRQSNKQISLGGKLTEILSQQGAKAGSVYEVPNAISPEWLIPNRFDRQNGDKPVRSENIRRFIFIGRYERRKGIEEINIVLKQLTNEGQKFECHFVGPIPDYKKLIADSHQLAAIKYHGLITDQQKIQQLLNDSDVLLCPSYSEGMPTVILEAMACNCAILATDVGASGDLVNKDNGWLIQGDIIRGLKKVMIEAIYLDSKNLQIMKENSLKKVKEKYTWDVVAQKSHDVFNE